MSPRDQIAWLKIQHRNLWVAVFDGAHLQEWEGNTLKKAEMEKLRKKRIYQAETRAKREG